jgi:hypothetical protein
MNNNFYTQNIQKMRIFAEKFYANGYDIQKIALRHLRFQEDTH